jgi:hypothetical protein
MGIRHAPNHGQSPDLSREHNLAFDLELDDKFVGSIVAGDMDRTLSEGLLGEWRRGLGV